jgi:hypothetical protein
MNPLSGRVASAGIVITPPLATRQASLLPGGYALTAGKIDTEQAKAAAPA